MLIGLTGGIASGKSAVAGILASLGAVIIDADVLAREVVEPGTPGLHAVVERFGPDVLGPDGRLDRSALATIVFSDPHARRDLEGIVHPLVRTRAADLTAQAGPDAIVVQVIPLLVETCQAGDFDHVVVVDVDEETQRQRLMDRDHATAEHADARIAAQSSRQARLAVADSVIDNSGSPLELETIVRDWWRSHVRP